MDLGRLSICYCPLLSILEIQTMLSCDPCPQGVYFLIQGEWKGGQMCLNQDRLYRNIKLIGNCFAVEVLEGFMDTMSGREYTILSGGAHI